MISILIIFSLVFAHEADHLILTQIVTKPNIAESISIYNPTNTPINLNNYYISDDKHYYKLQTENKLSPSNFINDYLAQFPNINIQPNDTLTIIFNADYSDFYGNSFNPDLVMYNNESNSMLETTDGSFGKIGVGKLDDDAELIILFYWDGNSNNPIYDVDYFLWGNNQNIIDKSLLQGYQLDTPKENQSYFKHNTEINYKYSRIGIEQFGESNFSSNGITGYDQTSEDFNRSWTIDRISHFTYGCTDMLAQNYNPLSTTEINTFYEHELGFFNFNPNLSCIYSFKKIINNEFGIEYPNIKVYGKVVDYFDIRTVSESGLGPQLITIEDKNGYRIDIKVFDWEISTSNVSEILTNYYENDYYIWAVGNLEYYESGDEWQVDISVSENIIVAQNYSSNGEYSIGNESNKVSINPAPFVLIPSLGETLDYNFTFPDKSRVIIRIFDLSGRFITSLSDTYYATAGTVYCDDPPASWDGRNKLGQIVEPGTYIMHIEAMNRENGETYTDAAPIIVGVKN